VEGNCDSAAGEALALQRAQNVRGILLMRGVPAGRVSALGKGDSRPVASNATASGREQNRRVEVVISGDPIGDLPVWDHTYSLSQRSGE
jgi:outer membrane protein OmpA-like peptidoglycan-associated protein